MSKHPSVMGDVSLEIIMIYVKGSDGTFVMDRKVSPSNNRGLYSTQTVEGSLSTIRKSETDTKLTSNRQRWCREDDSGQSTVSGSGMRLPSNQWF